MTLLFRNRDMSASELREQTHLTPGNLGSHMERLGAAGYVATRRLLINLGFEVHYAITASGVEAFRLYLDELQRFLDEARTAAIATTPRTATETPKPSAQQKLR